MTPDAKAGSAAVAAAAEEERAGRAHGAVAAVLRKAVDQARRASIADFARGEIAAERFAAAVDDALRALFDAGADRFPDAARRVTVAAVGGYGRRRLAPYSDVDLLFLLSAQERALKPLLDFLLYPLWDAGLKIGHAVHTPASAAAAVRSDLVARTAYMDARLLSGVREPLQDFQRRFAALRLTTKRAFRAAKLAELDARHQREAQSLYLAEPDLKEGKGGLRDLHTIAWIHRYEFDREIVEARARIFGAEEQQAFRRCERFLWSLRVQLHGLLGRADDHLSFDIQPQLAERLGYAGRGGMTAAERMMKDYFVNALEVGRLVRLFRAGMDELDARLGPRALQALPKALQTDELGRANLKFVVGRLAFDSPARARKAPLDLFRLFRAHAKKPGLDIHPEALSLVTAMAPTLPADIRKDADVARIFLATLTAAADPSPTLRVMAETGLLGRYIPSFGKIIGRIEYGLYRRYSVDESVFQSLAVLSEIERGDASARHPIATRILRETDERASFYLATLLHETEWSLRDPTPDAVEKLVETIVRRLGVEEVTAARVAWCAARPLFLVRTAERRDLTDPVAVARFAHHVGDQDRLDLLLVLAVCHLRVVGVSSWDEWRRRQISSLYEAARDYLSGGEPALLRRQQERAEAARDDVRRRLADGARLAEVLETFPDEMFRIFDAALIARIADLVGSAGDEAAVMLQPREGALEVVVYAEDRTGLLSDLAGAVSSAGASVRSVHAVTTAAGKAIDVFFLQTHDGAAIADPETVRKLHARLLAAARERPASAPSPLRRIGDRRAIFQIPARVAAAVDASAHALVVDAEGLDRPGLLHDLTAALAEMDLAIRSAHVATYGARAVDAFYVVEADGSKVANKRRIQAIERRLEAVLSQTEAARGATARVEQA